MINLKTKPERLNPQGTPVIWWIGTSTRQQKNSPLVQFEWCWKTSIENNLYPMAILRIPGHSRNYIFYQDAAKELPAYAKLLKIVEGNSIVKPKLLLTMARDRMGRNALATQVEALCDSIGCQIWSGRTGQPITSNVGQIFASGMELTLSRAESYQTQERRTGAIIRRVKEKKLPYGKPEYEYKIIRDERGKSVGIDANHQTAPTRQLIDQWYIEGNSPIEIALRLQRQFEGGNLLFAPPAGKLWHANIVRRLLKSKYPSGEYRARISGQVIVVQGEHPKLRTTEQQVAIERQLTRRQRGSQRGNAGPARYYGITYCANCGAKMIRMHTHKTSQNTDIDYNCSGYRYSLRTTTKVCSSHYTYENQITEAIADFFQRPIDEHILAALSKAPKDRSSEIKTSKKELEEIRRKKKEAIKLKLEYQFAQNEFVAVLTDLEQAEKDTLAEIKEIERSQAQIPDIENIKQWLGEMLSLPNLKEWLELEDPKTIRSILSGRIRVLCYHRNYNSLEPVPTVELVM